MTPHASTLRSRDPEELIRSSRRYPSAYRAWKRLGERTCELPSVVPFSQHLLTVGRRPGRRSPRST